MKIIYFGTPRFAVEPLKTLLANNFNVLAVATAPDKPAGRGLKVSSSDVKDFAVSKNLTVFQPEKLNETNFLTELKSLRADLFVIVAFRKLPEAVWKMPPLGTINLHASLLPDYRGAAPINHTIISGETKTGVTTFFINDKIDTGNIILQKKVSISENETAGELHDKLMHLGASLLLETVGQIQSGNAIEIEQNLFADVNKIFHSAPKLTREFCRINWNNSSDITHNFIRGLSPHPSAWTEIVSESEVHRLNIFRAQKEIVIHNLETGTIVSDNKSFLKIAVPDGFIHPLELQISGKKKLAVEEFLRGFKPDNCFFR
ncbi:MAG: methionyl-tRNA formyltransferase [Bacteroidia bacterium]|nr:methionyl-tRNA formyltransferase [Bacteroidia bacterium]